MEHLAQEREEHPSSYSKDYDQHVEGKHQEWYAMGPSAESLNVTWNGNTVIGLAWYDAEGNHIRTAIAYPHQLRDEAPVIYDERPVASKCGE